MSSVDMADGSETGREIRVTTDASGCYLAEFGPQNLNISGKGKAWKSPLKT